jgi:ATP sulfurylase/adenylyl-sulfate kinase
MSGFAVWFTGLSGSGKSTIAYALAPRLERLGLPVEILDGDEVRKRLTKGLGFSKEDRDENISRIAFVARSVVRAGGVAIACAISPYREARDRARAEIGRFVEVHVAPPLEECIRRDVKGLYKKALAGEIPSFTGVSDPYEPPLTPELSIPTERLTVDQSVELVLGKLRELGYIEGGPIPPRGGALIDRLSRRDVDDRLPALEIDAETADDLQNIGTGAFSPLRGFLGEADFNSVIFERRLSSGDWWTLPIVLDVEPEEAPRLGDRFALRHGGRTIALMSAESRYRPDKETYARQVFGTADSSHPGVARVLGLKPVFLGGPIELLGFVDSPLNRYRLTPARTRRIFAERGFRTVAAFQTRNVPHLGHEHLQRLALNYCDGLFVNPVIGRKKPGDFRDEAILATYERLTEFYPRERVVLGTLHTWMRYAGPIEAIHHAIVRKNYGCTHIIIGRDHAGVGKFYDPWAAQRAFEDYPGLGIEPLRFPESFYCRRCSLLATANDCPHGGEDRVSVSASQIRAALSDPAARLDYMVRSEILEVIRALPDPLL